MLILCLNKLNNFYSVIMFQNLFNVLFLFCATIIKFIFNHIFHYIIKDCLECCNSSKKLSLDDAYGIYKDINGISYNWI